MQRRSALAPELHIPRCHSPTPKQKPVNLHPSHDQDKPSSITFDIPFGSSKTSAKRTSPAVSVLVQLLTRRNVSRTLAHEVLQVMPLDIVRKVADVDTTVLLRRIPNTLHHLALGLDRTR
jgi:hypothetical protein